MKDLDLKLESVEQDEDLMVRCEICGVLATSLTEHLAALKPPEIQCLECTLCGRTFQSDRSIQQHSRFCQLGAGVDIAEIT